MKILFCGDVVGRSGRKVVLDLLPKLKEKWALDFIVVNGENAAHGFGLMPRMFYEFCEAGADVITLGNHTFDKKDIHDILDKEPFLVRPLNYPEGTIGHGYCIKTLANGTRVCVVQLLGKLFMKPYDNPFTTMEKWLEKTQGTYDVLIVDYHGEASAEKQAFGWFMDGKAALVIGTHTHVPTGDARLLLQGTAYMTDAGMCGDYNSVIGQQYKGAISRFLEGTKVERLQPAEGDGTFCGALIEIDDKTHQAIHIEAVRIGAYLANTHEI